MKPLLPKYVLWLVSWPSALWLVNRLACSGNSTPFTITMRSPTTAMLTIFSSVFQQKLTAVTLWMCFTNWFEEIKGWMAYSFLQLNESKSEILILGHSRTSSVFNLGSLSASVQHYVRNLVVTFDSLLNFEKQISTVIKGSFFHLRSIAKLKQLLPHKDLETVIHAFVTSRLDYCNTVYCGLPQTAISRLQVVQNTAARLLTGTKKGITFLQF